MLDELCTVRSKGPEGILSLSGPAGGWDDLIAANPRNRDRLLAIGTEEFERVMNRWMLAYVRGGARDYDHPPRTSMDVPSLRKGSRLIDPPWPEDAWELASEASNESRGSVFDPWVLGVPAILDFTNEP